MLEGTRDERMYNFNHFNFTQVRSVVIPEATGGSPEYETLPVRASTAPEFLSRNNLQLSSTTCHTLNQDITGSYCQPITALCDTHASTRVDCGHFDPGTQCTPSRPRTSRLAEIQNSFTKTDAIKNFHRRFSSAPPDLRDNVFKGKKRQFHGIHSQIFRGAPMSA